MDVEDYEPFSGIVLTDTFQLTEDGDLTDEVVFPANNTRAEAQKKLDIQVIVGNPPYSVGQTSGNDDNANVSYPTLDARVRDTFAARTDATNKNSLYDSYLRAIRWASDRIGDEGVIGFVTNGGWIEGNTAAGVRKTLAEEFSSIYVFNLRGNARTAGVLRQKEKGNVFGSGGRTTIAVFLLVRTQGHSGPATIHYRDIGDYLSREDKLAIVADSTLDAVPWQQITPNQYGDWINQRDEEYLTYPILGGQPSAGVRTFEEYSRGLETGRDAWVYNSSRTALDANLDRFIETYNAERARFAQHVATHNLTASKGSATVGVVSTDDAKIKWTSGLRDRAAKNRALTRSDSTIVRSLYRPFATQHVDITDGLIHRPAVARRYFPTAQHDNYGFSVISPRAEAEPAVLASRITPDVALFTYTVQFFPRYRWEPAEDEGTIAFDLGGEVVDGYRRVDNITDEFHRLIQDRYGSQVTKDDVFFFLYGLLHSPEYRERYAGELKQMLPRIPHVPAESFQPFVVAGRELFHLHADYEEAEPYPLEIVGGEQADLLQSAGSDADYYRVQKMRFPTGKKASDAPDTLIFNPHITVRGIPEEAYRYQLGSRSAIEWIIRQYQVTTDKASGIVNDPNQWGLEHRNPRYILDLLQKVVTVSVRTVEITESLPPLHAPNSK